MEKLAGQSGGDKNKPTVTQEEIDFQQAEESGAFWSSFFSSAVEAIPGTLQGIGALRASRNPNLTSYSPSLVGDCTYVDYGNNRRGFNNQDRPIGQGSRTMTIVIVSVVVVLVLVTLFVLLRKK